MLPLSRKSFVTQHMDRNVYRLKFKGRTSLMTVHMVLWDHYRSTTFIIYKPKNICSGGGEEEVEAMKEEVIWGRREENSQFVEISTKESQTFKDVKKRSLQLICIQSIRRLSNLLSVI